MEWLFNSILFICISDVLVVAVRIITVFYFKHIKGLILSYMGWGCVFNCVNIDKINCCQRRCVALNSCIEAYSSIDEWMGSV